MTWEKSSVIGLKEKMAINLLIFIHSEIENLKIKKNERK